MTDLADITRRLVALEESKDESGFRRGLEAAAKAVEALAGNRHYSYAFRKAARKIRSLKPE